MNPTETEVLVDVAVLGEQVDQFLKSHIGRYMVAKAEAEYDAGIESLKNCDPYDPIGISAAMNVVKRAESIKEWLVEAVGAGLRAQMILEDREE
jgi:hypothetical protein